MSRPRALSRRSAGFTLLELLVGLAILSMLVAALYAGLRSALAIAERGEARARAGESTREVTHFLRRILSSAVPVLELEAGKRRVILKADERSLIVGVDFPARFREGGIYEVELAPQASGSGLGFARRLLHPDVPAGSALIDSRTLLEEGEVRFRYFGQMRPRDERDWHDRWESNTRFPTLVAVQITTEQHGSWPQLTVRWPVGRARFQVRGRGQQGLDEAALEGTIEEAPPAAAVPDNE